MDSMLKTLSFNVVGLKSSIDDMFMVDDPENPQKPGDPMQPNPVCKMIEQHFPHLFIKLFKQQTDGSQV